MLLSFPVILVSQGKADDAYRPVPSNNASYISQSVVNNMTSGESYLVSVTMRNTGSTTWTRNAGYTLSVYDANLDRRPVTNYVWGINRAEFPGYDVYPGSDVTFSFNVRAPSSYGTYYFQWSMMQNEILFGETTPLTSIYVSGVTVSSYGDQAEFINQTIPDYMVAGQRYNILVTMKNTGSTTWMPGSYTLKSTGDVNYPTGYNMIIERPVYPGKTVTFEVPIVAPSSSGTYSLRWSMMNGNNYFGQGSGPSVVNVSGYYYPPPPPYPNYSAAYNTVSVPSYMRTNVTYDVSVTFTNTGSVSWVPGSYKLYSVPSVYTSRSIPWSGTSVDLNQIVYPGSSYTFSFRVTAPSEPGNYSFQWRLGYYGELFGDLSNNVTVTVER